MRVFLTVSSCCCFAYALVVAPAYRARPSTRLNAEISDVMQCLTREYRNFFDPLESEYYAKSVRFEDPLSTLSGLDAYRSNVDMLAGRTALGRLLFSDAAIALHSVSQTGERSLRTRWTLRVTFSILPWKPVARFSGISDYELGEDNVILGQKDYWDSIDLAGGEYSRSSKDVGIKDFAGQVLTTKGAFDGELPFELLRRGKGYSVRRYPACTYASVKYESRPEGYDILGSYTSGSNAKDTRLKPFLPSIIQVPRSGKGYKDMRWPIAFSDDPNTPPEPSSTAVSLRSEGEPFVVAVLVFPEAATEPAAKYYTKKLEEMLEADGLERLPETDSVYQIAQFDAIFSVGDRRNEVWIPIQVPDYWQL